jgi:hypothetical protein
MKYAVAMRLTFLYRDKDVFLQKYRSSMYQNFKHGILLMRRGSMQSGGQSPHVRDQRSPDCE